MHGYLTSFEVIYLAILHNSVRHELSNKAGPIVSLPDLSRLYLAGSSNRAGMSDGRFTAEGKTEAFPSLSPVASSDADETAIQLQNVRPRRGSSSARHGNRKTRSASLLQSMMQSNPPLGAWQAIGEDTAKGPTIPEIKNGAYSTEGWSHEGQLEKRNHNPHDIHKRRLTRSSSKTQGSKSTRPTTASTGLVAAPAEDEENEETAFQPKEASAKYLTAPVELAKTVSGASPVASIGPNEEGEYPNGYRFPKKHTWQQSCAIYGRAFWKFFCTIKGFLITIYALNVVAWGAMIFFLLIPGATPAMCKSYPDCNNKQYSARQIWIENTSQILTALFCVTAFGLLPWRLRDFYYMLRYQMLGDYDAHRKLAGFYRSWYRLPGSEKLPELLEPPAEPADLKAKHLFSLKKQPEIDSEKRLMVNEEIAALEANPAVPLPPWSMAPAPLTGIRARATKFSALAWMIWFYILNTLFQVGLCVVMWGFNSFQRNHAYFSALTALFIVLGCGTGIGAGIVVGREGKVIKETEGIPVKDYDVPETAADYQERLAKQNKKEEKKRRKMNKDEIDVVDK